VRWHDAELAEEKAPRLETTPGGAVPATRSATTARARRSSARTVNELGQGNNQWIFAVRDAALAARRLHEARRRRHSGDDRVLALDVRLHVRVGRHREVDGAAKWIAGLRRG
jgi:hypothetical protein